MTPRPFDIIRWESPKDPSLELLTRMLSRDGLESEAHEVPPQTHTPEMKFDRPAVRALVTGNVQYSFPGYGVIELHPGDILEILPDSLHDIIVSGNQPAILLEAYR